MPRIELVGGPRDGEILEVPELLQRVTFHCPADLPMAWEFADEAEVQIRTVDYWLVIPIRQRDGAVLYRYDGLRPFRLL